jgi:RNA polymerase sigma factor (sigma-70 family)
VLARHTPPTTDGLLLDRFLRDGDEAAFTALVARHGPGVWAACRRGTATEADAEDAFQATFLVLARRAGRVRRAASVGSWLIGVAVRLAQKTRARAARVPDPERLTYPTSEPDSVEVAARREVVTVLSDELARLPESLRAPLLACYFEGLTQDEAAGRLGWKVRTLKARVDRGRKLLRSRLARRGIDLSAALAAAALVADGLAVPPECCVIALDRAARPSVQVLTREGLAMTRRKVSVALAAGVVLMVALGTGLVLGQGKPPAKPVEPPAVAAGAKADLASDPLPPGALVRLGTTRFRFPGYEYRIFLLPEGDRALWVNEGSTVTYWDVVTGKVTASFRDPDLFTDNLELSPDGKYLALFGTPRSDQRGGPGTLRLYDLTARKTVWTTVWGEPPPRFSQGAVRFTPDGKRLLTVMGDEVRVWATADGAELRREKITGTFLAVAPDRTTVAVAGRTGLWLWDWTAADPPRAIATGPRDFFETAEFTPDGKTVRGLTTYGPDLLEFEAATGRPAGRQKVPFRYSFSPDGKTLAVPDDSSRGQDRPRSGLVLKDAATGAEIRRLSTGFSAPGGAPKQLTGAMWSRDGSRVATVAGQRLWVWDTGTGKLVSPTKPGHDGIVGTLAFAPDGRVFTGGDDHTVRAWDSETGRELFVLPMAGWARGVAVSPDGTLVAGNGLGNDLRVWDAKTGKVVFKLIGHGRIGGQRRARFSADEQTLLTYGDDYYVRAFSLTTGKLKAEHRFWPGDMAGPGRDEDELERMVFTRAVDFGPDGNSFVQAIGKDVQVIALDTGKERVRFEADPQHVQALAVSPDGTRLVTAGLGKPPPAPGVRVNETGPEDFLLTVWDLSTYKPVTRFRTRVPIPLWWGPLTFTPDGRQVVTGAYEPVLRFFDATTGAVVGTIDLPNRPESLAFDPPGKRIAVGFLDTTALIYDVAAAMKPEKKE